MANSTLKDIAQEMGISTTTVHRALHGKDRVSAKTRQKVLETASRLGYRTNYIAASLKRRPFRIAVALPEPSHENRYYYLSLWKGVQKFFETVTEFNVEVMDFSYTLTPEGNGTILREISENYADQIDGLVTIAVSHKETSYFIEKLASQSIPVALIGADLYKQSRFCCVKCYDETAGSLAAELLTAFHPKNTDKKIIITGNIIGDLTMTDQYDNAKGFEQYIKQHAPNIKILHAFNSNLSMAHQKIKELLLQNPDTYAIYSCSARHTIQMSKVVTEFNMQGSIKLVGNDCFKESLELLENGILTAIIDKKIHDQAYMAAESLFNLLVKSEYVSSKTLFVSPSIIMKGNTSSDKNIIDY